MPRISQVKAAQSDAALKEAGVWHKFEIVGVPEPVKLKLRGMSSNAAKMWDLKNYREQREYYEDGEQLPLEVIEQNETSKLAEALVVEWNITDDADQPLPVTVASVRDVMRQLPDLRTSAIAATFKLEKYRAQRTEALAKNSETPSLPDSATAAVPA